MTQRGTRRSRQFVLPVGRLMRIVVVVLAVMIVLGVVASGVVQRAAGGSAVADAASVAAQRSVVERDLERGYELSVDHVRKGRALNLAISAQQADTIANKALADLFTLRHNALAAIGQTFGSSNDASETYAKTAEQALDAKRGQPQPSAAAVLLAPRLYAIMSRFNDFATQLSDKAVADLTQAAAPAPTPTPAPTATGRPSSTPTPSR